MIMNAAFLVARDREPAFDAAVKEIDAALREPDLQVHRPLAAVQLRQHPAEARARLGSRIVLMLILDSLLIGGIRFVLDKVASAVERAR